MNRFFIFPLFLVLCLFARGAGAGPWPQPVGETFVSVTREFRDGGNWDAAYAEYGLTEKITLVFDGGRAQDGRWIGVAAFRSLLWAGETQRLAFSLGIGAQHLEDGELPPDAMMSSLAVMGMFSPESQIYPVFQSGLSWGTGFEVYGWNGWTAIDLIQRKTPEINSDLRKVDAVIGVKPREGRMFYTQIQYADAVRADEQLRLGVNWVEDFGPLSLEFGAGKQFRLEQEADVKIGVWFKF